MQITITNLTRNVLSTDLGSLKPTTSLTVDLPPEQAYLALQQLGELQTKGYLSLTVSDADAAVVGNSTVNNLTVTGSAAPSATLSKNLGSASDVWLSTFTATVKDSNSVNRIICVSGQANTYDSAIASPGATDVAHVFNTTAAYAVSGGKLAQFLNNSTEKTFVDLAGNVEVVPVGSGFIMKSPNGTRYLLKVANDGTLSASTA